MVMVVAKTGTGLQKKKKNKKQQLALNALALNYAILMALWPLQVWCLPKGGRLSSISLQIAAVA